jgi:hypothetical protein
MVSAVIWVVEESFGMTLPGGATDPRLQAAARGSSSNCAKIYSEDPGFGLIGEKNRSQTAKTREHCVKYVREIRIDRKFCSCRAVFHAVNDPSIMGLVLCGEITNRPTINAIQPAMWVSMLRTIR